MQSAVNTSWHVDIINYFTHLKLTIHWDLMRWRSHSFSLLSELLQNIYCILQSRCLFLKQQRKPILVMAAPCFLSTAGAAIWRNEHENSMQQQHRLQVFAISSKTCMLWHWYTTCWICIYKLHVVCELHCIRVSKFWDSPDANQFTNAFFSKGIVCSQSDVPLLSSQS